jgi:hypothetical protein
MRGSLSIDLCLNSMALASSTSPLPPQPTLRISEREKPVDDQRVQNPFKEILKQFGLTDEALLMELWGMGDCSFDHFFAVLQSRLDARGREQISQQVARRIYMVCLGKKEQAGECVPFPQKGEDKVSQSKNSRRAEIPRVISAKVGPGLAGLDEWCNDVILQLSAEDRPRTSESAHTRGFHSDAYALSHHTTQLPVLDARVEECFVVGRVFRVIGYEYFCSARNFWTHDHSRSVTGGKTGTEGGAS